MESIEYYYKHKEYNKIFDCFLSDAHDSIDIIYLLYALFETGHWNGYTKLFRLHISKIESLYDTSRLRGYNGLLLFSNGQYEQAKANLQNAVDQAGEYSFLAKEWLNALQLKTFEYSTVERLNFHYTSELTLEQRKHFVNKYLSAYDRITKIFPYKKQKNIDVFVFAGWKDNIGNNLSYANTHLATIHVNNTDDAGHELAHILCKETLSINNTFIDEGLAEYFDDLIRGYKIILRTPKPTLQDLFTKFRDYDQDFSYLYARVFISCVFKYYNGDIEAARRILEASSVKQLHSNSAVDLSLISTHTQNTFSDIVVNKRKGAYVYVGRSDLFALDDI